MIRTHPSFHSCSFGYLPQPAHMKGPVTRWPHRSRRRNECRLTRKKRMTWTKVKRMRHSCDKALHLRDVEVVWLFTETVEKTLVFPSRWQIIDNMYRNPTCLSACPPACLPSCKPSHFVSFCEFVIFCEIFNICRSIALSGRLKTLI